MIDNKNLKSYLAGLIEGNGSFIVPGIQRDHKGRVRYAKIKIAFHITDKPLFSRLKKHFGGCFELYKNYGVWIINKNENLIFICKFINGYLKTPKINDFHRLINYLNSKSGLTIDKLGLNSSPIHSDSWLAGFSEADANFNLLVTTRKNSRKRIQIQYRIEIKRFYSKNISQTLPSGFREFYPICEQISTYLGVGVYSRTRSNKFYGLIVTSYNRNSNAKVIEYFEKFPLFSSKRLNYEDWKIVYNLQLEKLHLTPSGIKTCEDIKKNFNKNRQNFCWKHLKDFYI